MNKIILLPISMIGLIIVPFIIYTTISKRKIKRRIKQKMIVDPDVNYNEIGKNIGYGISPKRKELYDKLITNVHPDKFHDNRISMATKLSQRITEAKYNYHELLVIEKDVNDFLLLNKI